MSLWSQKLAIHSIYRATEGEGEHVGTPQIFVRTQGCAVGCLNCDSKETWEFKKEAELTLETILDSIYLQAGTYPKQIKRVSITGGDPLHPKLLPGVLALTAMLKREGFYVNIEASGTRIVDELFDIIDYISFDYKTPSTGVKTNPALLNRLMTKFPGKYQIKSVVADRGDFEKSLEVYNQLFDDLEEKPNWYLTPCYEPTEATPFERIHKVIDWNHDEGAPFKVVAQQHKLVYGTKRLDI